MWTGLKIDIKLKNTDKWQKINWNCFLSWTNMMYLVDFHSFLPPKKQKTKLVTLTPTQRCNTIRCTNLCYEPFHPRILLFAFQWRQSAEVVILFIQYSSRLLQHSSLSVWPLWWFVAHLKPHTCDLLVKVTTKPQHGWPSLLLSHWGLCRCVHQHALAVSNTSRKM